MVTLGEKVVALRKQRGWTQRYLARRAGIRPALLSELESGKKSDTTGLNLRKLAMALGVTTDYLTGLTSHPG